MSDRLGCETEDVLQGTSHITRERKQAGNVCPVYLRTNDSVEIFIVDNV